jgi:lipid-A-disaccharide synthase
MKFYIICSERSGDQHVAALVAELKKQLPTAEFRGVGGSSLESEGVTLYLNYKEINFMGVWEVVRNSDYLLKKIREIVSDIKAFDPDAVVFVDSSSLNIRISKQFIYLL